MSKSVVKTIDIEGPAPAPSRDPVLSMLEGVVNNTGASIERVEQAFAFYQKVEADRARKEFIAAMVAAQEGMEPVRKDAFNPQTRSKYATFEALDRAVRPIYVRNGFVPTYRTEESTKLDHIKVVLSLLHKGGHEREYTADMPADGKGAKGGDVMSKTHAFGSAFSYGKRYVLGGAFNIITTERDDDGNAAGAKPEDKDALIAEVKRLARLKHVSEAAILERFSVGDFADLTLKQLNSAVAGLNKTAVQS